MLTTNYLGSYLYNSLYLARRSAGSSNAMKIVFQTGMIQKINTCAGVPLSDERLTIGLLLWAQKHRIIPQVAPLLELTADQAEAQLRRFKLLPVKTRRGAELTAALLDVAEMRFGSIEVISKA